MPNFFDSKQASKSRRRRPAGVSRRQRKLNLGFETLEDRRVMSSDTSLPLIPSDPLFQDQWYLLNVGQQIGGLDFQQTFGTPGEDINFIGARELGLTGAGIVVAVIDTGVQTNQPDLANNILTNLQFDGLIGDGNANPFLTEFDTNTIDPNSPFPPLLPSFFEPLDARGTAIAGIIAAEENGSGTVGIAPNASIIPIQQVDPFGFAAPAGLNSSLRFAIANGADIVNIAGQGVDGIRQLEPLTPAELLALRDSVIGPNAGRNGLGSILVVGAGDGAGVGFGEDSAALNGLVNSRYTIAVSGIGANGTFNNDDGTVLEFPEAGASVLLAAPIGLTPLNVGDDTGVTTIFPTTDTVGLLDTTGFNIEPDPFTGQEFDRDFTADESITRLFPGGGTAAAAAQVSGVTALILEANPNLSFRDVQEILVRSARTTDVTATQQNGFDIVQGSAGFQSTYIINQIPLFQEPDLFDPAIPNGIQFFNPIQDPLRLGIGIGGVIGTSSAPSPQVLTTGAGFTVSQGRGTNGEQIGVGHGVLDAGLAVRLAQQWTTTNQQLAPERTFTTTPNLPFANNLPAAQLIDPDGIEIIVPGSLGGGDSFRDFFDEFFEDTPDFTQAFDSRGGGLELTVPQVNGEDIVVESVEVRVTIDGDANATSEALDHLRIVLVSPDGTHSELNDFTIDPSFGGDANAPQAIGVGLNGLDGISTQENFIDQTPATAGPLSFTFLTNRSRGERSDDAIIFDPTTNEPYVTPPGLGGNVLNGFGGLGVPSSVGDLVSRGWQLHFENYGTSSLALADVDITWHGAPVGADTERVRGFVGLDDNQDDIFNFSRVIQSVVDTDGDPTTIRLQDVQTIIDPNQETFAPDVTVFAFEDVDPTDGSDVNPDIDILVDQFLTGHDGNYYFDLVPGNYIITTDDPRAIDDELTPDGFLPEYRTSWQINENFFTPFDFDANLEVPVTIIDGVETPSPFLDGSGNQVVTGIKNLNFLLDPGPAAANEANFSGVIFADFDGDGVFNGDDINVPNILVFADTNQNGQFDSGETFTQTDDNGAYNLIVETDNVAVIDVGVVTPVDFNVVAPSGGTASFLQNGIPSTLTFDAENSTYTFFTQPGDVLTGVDFAVQPPFASDGSGSTNPVGTIFGTVFNDADGNQFRAANETSFANVTIFIDVNNNTTLDPGEVSTTTNVNGSFVFTEVPAGQHFIRISGAPSSLIQTTPVSFPIGAVANAPNVVTLNPGGTITGVTFGLFNDAELDFGDLPAIFNLTTLADNGARNIVGNGFHFLGSPADTELDGTESPIAAGDDTNLNDDEDGIVFAPLTAGDQAADAQGQITVTASNSSGFLQGWIDFNGDGDFFDDGEQIIQNLQVPFGESDVSFDLPDVIADPDAAAAGGIFARFRYGSFNQGLTGLDVIGEVEDYILHVAPPPEPLVLIDPDTNNDGIVNGFDFLALQRSGANSESFEAFSEAYGQDGAPQALLAAQQEEDNDDSIEPAALLSSSVASGIASTAQLSTFESQSLAGTVTTEETLLESVAPAPSALSSTSLDSAYGESEAADTLTITGEADEEATLEAVFDEEIDWRF